MAVTFAMFPQPLVLNVGNNVVTVVAIHLGQRHCVNSYCPSTNKNENYIANNLMS